MQEHQEHHPTGQGLKLNRVVDDECIILMETRIEEYGNTYVVDRLFPYQKEEHLLDLQYLKDCIDHAPTAFLFIDATLTHQDMLDPRILPQRARYISRKLHLMPKESREDNLTPFPRFLILERWQEHGGRPGAAQSQGKWRPNILHAPNSNG